MSKALSNKEDDRKYSLVNIAHKQMECKLKINFSQKKNDSPAGKQPRGKKASPPNLFQVFPENMLDK